jgi:hypothetical protein
MQNEDALEVLETEGALQKKFSVKQFVALSVITLILPAGILVAVWSTLS